MKEDLDGWIYEGIEYIGKAAAFLIMIGATITITPFVLLGRLCKLIMKK